VPATECHSVGDCAQCGPTQTCVIQESQLGNTRHCVEVPPACGAKPNCACLGAAVCVGTNDTCNDSGGQIVCSCPNC
jgi:hypothetical protein